MKRKMINKRKLFILLLGVLIFFSTFTIAFANPIKRSLRATYNNIKLVVNGKNVNFNNNDEPFIVNGVTYLPVRKVGEALGKDVNWNSQTKTITISDKVSQNITKDSNVKSMVDILRPSFQNINVKVFPSTSIDPFYINNVKYDTGLASIHQGSNNIVYDLDGKYSTLEFDYGVLGDPSEVGHYVRKIVFEGMKEGMDKDYKELDVIYFDRNSGINKHILDVRGVKKLNIYSDSKYNAIGNPILK